jgi:secretion/DNA translocation related TadE-like protein
MPTGRSPNDRGSGSVLVLALGTLVVLSTVVGVVRGGAVVARHRADAAADLAALAAAAEVIDGAAAACGVAEEIAAENGARMSGCVVTGSVVEVLVERPLPLGRFGGWRARARARAGPGRGAPSSGDSGPAPRRPDWRRT